MKAAALVLSTLFVIAAASPAHAQLGGLGKIKKHRRQGRDAKDKYDDFNITDEEERQLGEQVSAKLREQFGVYQDAAVTKYVTLVGTALAQASTRPEPGLAVHRARHRRRQRLRGARRLRPHHRGLLGLMKNEAELAGVLGHEITHVTEKHTVHAIQKSKGDGDRHRAGDQRRRSADAVPHRQYGDQGVRQDLRGRVQPRGRERGRRGRRPPREQGRLRAGRPASTCSRSSTRATAAARTGTACSPRTRRPRSASTSSRSRSPTEKLTGKATAEARYKPNITFDAKPVTRDRHGRRRRRGPRQRRQEERRRQGKTRTTRTRRPTSRRRRASA